MDYSRFTKEWYKRATDERDLDTPDRFLNLWISFNGWMKNKYGESLQDKQLLQKVKREESLKQAFEVKKDSLDDLLSDLKRFSVLDMRDETNKERIKNFDDSFESLIEVLYQIRCNLFHGRKCVDEDENDKRLVELAYKILQPIFHEVLESDL